MYFAISLWTTETGAKPLPETGLKGAATSGQSSAVEQQPKKARSRPSDRTKVEPPTVDEVLRFPIEVFVSCGEQFMKPESKPSHSLTAEKIWNLFFGRPAVKYLIMIAKCVHLRCLWIPWIPFVRRVKLMAVTPLVSENPRWNLSIVETTGLK